MLSVLLLACSDPLPPKARPAPKVEAEPEEEEEELARPERPAINKAPLVRGATLTPRNPTIKDEILVDVEVTDPEGLWIDKTFTWTVNGDVVGGYRDQRLAAGIAKRGDVVGVRIAASDGEHTAEADLGSVTVVNASPVMETQPEDIRSIDYLPLKARDPDGDPITWKLEAAPEGMTVDAGGIVRYKPSLTAKGGKYVAKVTAEDGNGGWARLDLPVTIAAGSDAPKDTPKDTPAGGK